MPNRRGRPPKDGITRDKRLTVRCTAEDKAILEQKAGDCGMNVSDYLLDCMRNLLKK